MTNDTDPPVPGQGSSEPPPGPKKVMPLNPPDPRDPNAIREPVLGPKPKHLDVRPRVLPITPPQEEVAPADPLLPDVELPAPQDEAAVRAGIEGALAAFSPVAPPQPLDFSKVGMEVTEAPPSPAPADVGTALQPDLQEVAATPVSADVPSPEDVPTSTAPGDFQPTVADGNLLDILPPESTGAMASPPPAPVPPPDGWRPPRPSYPRTPSSTHTPPPLPPAPPAANVGGGGKGSGPDNLNFMKDDPMSNRKPATKLIVGLIAVIIFGLLAWWLWPSAKTAPAKVVSPEAEYATKQDVQQLAQKVEDLSGAMVDRFGKVDEKFDAVDKKVDAMQTTLSKIDKNVAALKSCACKKPVPKKAKPTASAPVAQPAPAPTPAPIVTEPAPQYPPAPVPASAPASSVQCAGDCVSHPIAILRKRETNPDPDPKGICAIVAEDDQQKPIAYFMLQPYHGEGPKQGNLHIMQVKELKQGQVERIEGAITNERPANCRAALSYVERNWQTMVAKFHLPNTCRPNLPLPVPSGSFDSITTTASAKE